MPKTTNTKTILLNPTEVRYALLEYFNLEGGDLSFVVEGVEDPDDFRAELPLSYELVAVKIKMSVE